MRNYWTILKVTMKNAIRPSDSKKGSRAIYFCALAVLGIIFVVGLVSGTVFMGPAFLEQGMGAEYMTIMFVAAQMVVLIFGTAFMIGVVFFHKDADIVLALPVKASTLFFAKLTYVYLTELAMAAFVVLTSGITLGILGGFGLSFYLILIAASLILPLLPLLIGAILSLPIMYIISYFKKRGAVTGILLAVLMRGFFVAYFAVFANLSGGEADEEFRFFLSEESIAAIRQAMNFVLPDFALAKLIFLRDVGPSILTVVISYGVLGGLAYLVAVLTYRKSLSIQLEASGSQKIGKVEYKSLSVQKTLIRKDAREILRHHYLMFYVLMQVLFGPILVFFLGSQMQELNNIVDMSIISLVTGFYLISWIGVGMNYIALSAITREGENFAFIKTLPINFRAYMKAKVRLSNVISYISVGVGSLVLVLTGVVNVYRGVLTAVALAVLADGFNHFLCNLDLVRPRLHYESLAQVLKNNVNSFIALGVVLLAILPIAIVLGVCSAFLPMTGAWLEVVMWVIIGAIVVGENFLFRSFLFRNLEIKLRAIEC